MCALFYIYNIYITLHLSLGLSPPALSFPRSIFLYLSAVLSYTKQQFNGAMGLTPSSPHNMYNGLPQQAGAAGMAGYGAPQPQGYSGPAITIPAMPGYGGLPTTGGLPPGWESRVEPDGRTVYIDHNTKVYRLTSACMWWYDEDRSTMNSAFWSAPLTDKLSNTLLNLGGTHNTWDRQLRRTLFPKNQFVFEVRSSSREDNRKTYEHLYRSVNILRRTMTRCRGGLKAVPSEQ